ncbi:DUF438 domain-containing protein [Formosa undariae]|uniref:DUF438 domain-containing protein n=1 Tax=Formosa undariae TaxID=1325436 RepID=A0ABV5EYJ0_9FLAO
MNTVIPVIDTLAEGHPVRVYFEEAKLIEGLLKELHTVNPSEDFQKYYNIFNQLATIEKRFARKENQLFPYLEKYEWYGPTKQMWSFHDTLRDQIRLLNTHNEAHNISKIKEDLPYLSDGIKRLLEIEKMRLFPNAIDLLSEADWKEFYEGDEEIGWMLPNKPMPYPAIVKRAYEHPSQATNAPDLSFSLDNTFHYDEGYMTPEQVNLLLRVLPFDVTYVDENDKVIFYNRGDNRVFPRSKGIIGREVKFCHPPKSVDTVLKILEEFKAGRQDVADFWFDMKGQIIYIRYFAIRDNNKAYKGVLEVSQDITNIKKLEGQKRLLDWA